VPGKGKQPYYFHLKSGQPFAFAGLWKTTTTPDGAEMTGAVIITTEPNDLIAKYHNRMGVIIPAQHVEQWLTPGDVEPSELDSLLRSYPSEEMEAYPVSKDVNYPGSEGPDLIKPIDPGPPSTLF